MRLDKLLSSGLGLGSRTDVKKMIKKGRIRVDGIEIIRPETNIDPNSAAVYVDGTLMKYREFVYLMLNKPQGVISATYDKTHKTVIDLVPEEYAHFEVFPVGRLDIDTEGLCLLTNDGALSHKLLSPKNHVPKTYIARINMPITESDISAFREGIILDDGYKCMPSELTVSDEDSNMVYVKIFEGKFHQIKRMFEAVGKSVVYLKRVKFKDLVLDEMLVPGEIRELTNDELSALI